MKSRLFAGVAAVLLAIIGAFLVFSYAQNSDARAMAGMEPVDVLVVQKAIPAGTKAEALAGSVAVEQLPASAVPNSALQDLEDASGKVTAVDLVAGEQLLSTRLVNPQELETAGTIEVPKGLQEVSFLLEPQRAVGGNIAPGDHVGINISYVEGSSEGVPTTKFVYHKVLVTNVQKATAPSAEGAESTDQDTSALPTGSLLLTIAVDDAKTARIVHGSEFGTLWLSKEPTDASESDNGIITTTEVYE